MSSDSLNSIPRKDIPAALRRLTGSNKNVHESTIRRWYTKGVKGVVLKVEYVGGEVFTTHANLREFIAATTFVALRKHRKPFVATQPAKFDSQRAQRVKAELLASLD